MRDKLVEENLGLAYSLVDRYKNRGIDITDLRSLALEGLVLGVDAYGTTKKGTLSTHIYYNVKHNICKEFKKIKVNKEKIERVKPTLEDEVTINFETLLDTKNQYDNMLKAINKLPLKQRYVIEKRFLSKNIKSMKNIAQKLNVSQQRIDQLTKQAIKNIQKELNIA